MKVEYPSLISEGSLAVNIDGLSTEKPNAGTGKPAWSASECREM